MPPPTPKRGRGHPQVYSDRLFLKALVIMIVRQIHSVVTPPNTKGYSYPHTDRGVDLPRMLHKTRSLAEGLVAPILSPVDVSL